MRIIRIQWNKKINNNIGPIAANIDYQTEFSLAKVVLSKPERFDDASGIADNLNDKRTVVLNLEGTNRDTARRLIDFLSGVAYANGGQIKKVANNTYIITPYNVDISGDLIDELENTGMYFGNWLKLIFMWIEKYGSG